MGAQGTEGEGAERPALPFLQASLTSPLSCPGEKAGGGDTGRNSHRERDTKSGNESFPFLQSSFQDLAFPGIVGALWAPSLSQLPRLVYWRRERNEVSYDNSSVQ